MDAARGLRTWSYLVLRAWKVSTGSPAAARRSPNFSTTCRMRLLMFSDLMKSSSSRTALRQHR